MKSEKVQGILVLLIFLGMVGLYYGLYQAYQVYQQKTSSGLGAALLKLAGG